MISMIECEKVYINNYIEIIKEKKTIFFFSIVFMHSEIRIRSNII